MQVDSRSTFYIASNSSSFPFKQEGSPSMDLLALLGVNISPSPSGSRFLYSFVFFHHSFHFLPPASQVLDFSNDIWIQVDSKVYDKQQS